MNSNNALKQVALLASMIIVLLAATVISGAKDTTVKGVKIEQGALGASKIMIAVPKKWNKHVLILAHGLRMENAPVIADFSIDGEFMQAMLKDGWIIASTSYRRNGYLHDEAIEDLDELRQHVIDTYGKPERIYLDGGSMGGAIVTKMAETHKEKYDGVLAIGAALGIGNIKYSFAPQMPLLFISNQNELADPKKYLEGAAQAEQKPAIWQVKRDGHCNLNDKEGLAALRALVAYRETGKIERDKDATVVITPKSVAKFRDGGAYAGVTGVSSAYGNFDTKFTAANLEKLGITRGESFNVSFKDKAAKVLYGTSYFDVPRGEWVAFITADGYLKIARQFESAVAVLGCKEGDIIFIKAIPKEEGGKQ